ncbi:MAG: leucine-rich repeat domain-containing protein, partial [Muribaculaceae bacterium]|nr:leucine-rich repeat domain-containing protein [Muribaculaceae bacterium]
SIGSCTFSSCDNLSSIIVQAENQIYDSRDDCNAIIETSSNMLIQGCKNTTIPNSVTTIGDYAFLNCSGLTSIGIPNNVTSIGKRAFCYCTGLTSVSIGSSVTSIADDAFYQCTDLTSISIPNSVKSIGQNSFYYCSSLSNLKLGNGLTTFGLYAFKNCNTLTEVHSEIKDLFDFPANVFQNVNLSNCTLYVPQGMHDEYLIHAMWGRFGRIIEEIPLRYDIISENDRNCEVVHDEYSGPIIVPETTIINEVTYHVVGIGEEAFANCNVTEVSLPHGLEYINSGAFNGCRSVKSITIPREVEYIGEEAFASCDSLTTMVVESGNSVYDSREGCNAIIHTSSNTLVAGCNGTIIPSSVTNIWP